MFKFLIFLLIVSCSNGNNQGSSQKTEGKIQVFEYEPLTITSSGNDTIVDSSSLTMEAEEGKKILQQIYIKNSSRAALSLENQIDLLEIQGYSEISIINNCPISLARLRNCNISIEYTASSDNIGLRNINILGEAISLTFLRSDPVSNPVEEPSSIVASISEINFGSMKSNEERVFQLTLKNTGRTSVDLPEKIISSDEFLLVLGESGECGSKLDRLKACRITLKNKSQEVLENSNKTATLSVGNISVNLFVSYEVEDLSCTNQPSLLKVGEELSIDGKSLTLRYKNNARAVADACVDGDMTDLTVDNNCTSVRSFRTCDMVFALSPSVTTPTQKTLIINGQETLLSFSQIQEGTTNPPEITFSWSYGNWSGGECSQIFNSPCGGLSGLGSQIFQQTRVSSCDRYEDGILIESNVLSSNCTEIADSSRNLNCQAPAGQYTSSTTNGINTYTCSLGQGWASVSPVLSCNQGFVEESGVCALGNQNNNSFVYHALDNGSNAWQSTNNVNGSLASNSSGDKMVYFAGNNQKVYYSGDSGRSWQESFSLASQYISSVKFLNNKFILVFYGFPSLVYSSEDGISWTTHALSGSFVDIAYGNGRYVVIGGSSVGTSSDLNNWNYQSVGANIFNGDLKIKYDSFKNIFVATSSTAFGSSTIMKSDSNGLNWGEYLPNIVTENNAVLPVVEKTFIAHSSGISIINENDELVDSGLTSYSWNDLVNYNGIIFAVGNKSFFPQTPAVAYSASGNQGDWTVIDIEYDIFSFLRGVAIVPEGLIVVGSNSRFLRFGQLPEENPLLTGYRYHPDSITYSTIMIDKNNVQSTSPFSFNLNPIFGAFDFYNFCNNFGGNFFVEEFPGKSGMICIDYYSWPIVPPGEFFATECVKMGGIFVMNEYEVYCGVGEDVADGWFNLNSAPSFGSPLYSQEFPLYYSGTSYPWISDFYFYNY